MGDQLETTGALSNIRPVCQIKQNLLNNKMETPESNGWNTPVPQFYTIFKTFNS